MLFVVEERLEGLKYNQESAPDTKYISRDGVEGTQGEGYAYFIQKRGHSIASYCRYLKTETHIFSSDPSIRPFDNNSEPTSHGGKIGFLLCKLFQIM